MTATLIVSVSGVTDSTLSRCASFATELDSRLVPVSWLLPPRPREGRHSADGASIGYLRERVRPGGVVRDALVLHGFDHAVPPLARPRIGRRAEFAGLPSHEASLRLIAAVRTMDELGLHSDVFAPPRWLSSDGTLVALAARKFRVCADTTGVHLLDGSGRTLRGRVLAVAPPSWGPNAGRVIVAAASSWGAGALVALAARTARRGGLVRIAADAADLAADETRRSLLDAIDAALTWGAQPTTYRAPLPVATAIPA